MIDLLLTFYMTRPGYRDKNIQSKVEKIQRAYQSASEILY